MKGIQGKVSTPLMRYISQLDYGAWFVRVPGKPSKTFSWKKYGGEGKSLEIARQWRNETCLLVNIVIKNKKRGTGRCIKKARGYALTYSRTKNSYDWVAYHYCNGRNRKKSFAVNKYGYKRARELAKQHRIFLKTGVLVPIEDVMNHTSEKEE